MTPRFISLTLATLLLAATGWAQVPSGRIVTIDLNRVFTEYYKTPAASQRLKDTAEQYNREHDDLMAKYRNLVADLDKLRDEQGKSEFTAEVREQKKKAVEDKLAETQKLQREIEEFRASHRQMLDQQTQRMRLTIIKEIREIIVKESRDAGYTLVLDKSGNTANGEPTIIFSKDEIDVTEDIIKILNKNKPVTEAPKTDDKKSDKK